MKMFGKNVNDNPIAMALYQEYKALRKQKDDLEKQCHDNFIVYCNMEGKYAQGTTPDLFAGQGCRGYDYKYATPEDKNKEIVERDIYYKANIQPLKTQINELQEKLFALNESICVALWGFSSDEYYLRDALAKAEKELAQQIEVVKDLQEKIKKFEKTS